MARYIDAEALLESVKSKRLIFEESTPVEEAIAEQTSVFEDAIEEAPTAEVAPKSEIDRLIKRNEILEAKNKVNDKVGADYIKVCEENKRLAREIFEEIEGVLNVLDNQYMLCGNPKQSWGVRGAMTKIAELKKKYTEGAERHE